jgi:uncharacterized protein with HEPN domain
VLPRSRTLVMDMLDAAITLRDRCAEITLAEYLADDWTRWAIERGLEVLGEAGHRLVDQDPETAARIPQMRGIIGTGNAIADGYDSIDANVIVSIVRERLVELIPILEALLEDRNESLNGKPS